jgi:hypothetical protein
MEKHLAANLAPEAVFPTGFEPALPALKIKAVMLAPARSGTIHA